MALIFFHSLIFKMLGNGEKGPKWRPCMSCFVHSPKNSVNLTIIVNYFPNNWLFCLVRKRINTTVKEKKEVLIFFLRILTFLFFFLLLSNFFFITALIFFRSLIYKMSKTDGKVLKLSCFSSATQRIQFTVMKPENSHIWRLEAQNFDFLVNH